jgi:hypothetical protein
MALLGAGVPPASEQADKDSARLAAANAKAAGRRTGFNLTKACMYLPSNFYPDNRLCSGLVPQRQYKGEFVRNPKTSRQRMTRMRSILAKYPAVSIIF